MKKNTHTKTAGRIVMMMEHQDLKNHVITVSLLRAGKKTLIGSPVALSKKPEVIRQLSKKMAMRLAMLVVIESSDNVQRQRMLVQQPILKKIACAA